MKKAILILTVLTLFVSCSNDVTTIDTTDLRNDIDDNTTRIVELEKKVATLEVDVETLQFDLDELATNFDIAMEDINLTICAMLDRLMDHDADIDSLKTTDETILRKIRRIKRRIRNINNKICNIDRIIFNLQRTDYFLSRRIQQNANDLVRNFNYIKRVDGTLRFFMMMEFFESMMFNQRFNNLQNQIFVNASNISDLDGRIDGLEESIEESVEDLQLQIDNLSDKVVEVIYPCGEGNSEEVLLKTQDGLVAYFQSGHNESITFLANKVVPARRVCIYYKNNRCRAYRDYPSYTTTVEESVSFFVLDKAFLDVLNDGHYVTTDGCGCVFEISNGELVSSEVL